MADRSWLIEGMISYALCLLKHSQLELDRVYQIVSFILGGAYLAFSCVFPVSIREQQATSVGVRVLVLAHRMYNGLVLLLGVVVVCLERYYTCGASSGACAWSCGSSGHNQCQRYFVLS